MTQRRHILLLRPPLRQTTRRLLLVPRLQQVLLEQIHEAAVDLCKSPETSTSSETGQHRVQHMFTTPFLTVKLNKTACLGKRVYIFKGAVEWSHWADIIRQLNGACSFCVKRAPAVKVGGLCVCLRWNFTCDVKVRDEVFIFQYMIREWLLIQC